MVGTSIVIFARVGLLPIISEVRSSYVKRGFFNVLGNKGAVSVAMKLGETRVRFINCHLTAGQGHIRKRSKDIAKVLDSEVDDITEEV